MRRIVTLGLTLAFLTACMPGRIDYVRVSSSYAPEQYHHLPRTPYLRAEVSGNPFGMDPSQFSALVNDAIQPYPGVPPANAGYRVHLAFNGARATNENFACSASGGPAEATGEIRLIAAFCSGAGQALTYLVATLEGANGAEDPRFRAFVRWVVVSLFPPSSNDDRNDSNCFWPAC